MKQHMLFYTEGTTQGTVYIYLFPQDTKYENFKNRVEGKMWVDIEPFEQATLDKFGCFARRVH